MSVLAKALQRQPLHRRTTDLPLPSYVVPLRAAALKTLPPDLLGSAGVTYTCISKVLVPDAETVIIDALLPLDEIFAQELRLWFDAAMRERGALSSTTKLVEIRNQVTHEFEGILVFLVWAPDDTNLDIVWAEAEKAYLSG